MVFGDEYFGAFKTHKDYFFASMFEWPLQVEMVTKKVTKKSLKFIEIV